MLNFNRRDGAPDPRTGVKSPLKPALYEPPESQARAAAAPTRPSMPSAPSSAAATGAAVPSSHDAVSTPARSGISAMPVAAAGSTLSVGINPLYSGSGTLLDVPTFLSERFNSTKVNGAPLSKINPTATNRVTSAGVVQIRTGTLSTAGVDFTEFFRHH